MIESLLNQAEYISYYLWISTLVLMSVWEGGSPRRHLNKPIRRRWVLNIGMTLSGAFVVRLMMPILGMETARRVMSQGWGLFSYADVPFWLNLVLGLLVLDLARYGIHWAAHRYAVIWRIHRVHHTDQELDFTTSLRNHPLEIVTMTIINLALITLLGIHPVAFLVAESLAITLNTFNHGNVVISARLDRALRFILVTPDMHRVHHSTLPRELNANLGGVVPWWDWLFGTYVAQPRQGHETMPIGLTSYADEQRHTFIKMLLDPFISSAAEYKANPLAQSKNNFKTPSAPGRIW